MADIVQLGARGEIVLPRKVRADLGLRAGDTLTVELDGESIVVRRKARRFAEYLEKVGRR